MSDESAFLAAIIAQPDDDTLRLVYADWLDEQGDADRAEFIRLQIRLAGMSWEDPKRDAVYQRTRELFNLHKDAWRAGLPSPVKRGATIDCFERGFLTKLDANVASLLKVSKRAWAKYPIQSLYPSQASDKLGALLAIPAMPRISYVSLYAPAHSGSLSKADLKALTTCPNLTGMRTLLISSAVGDALATALAKCPSLRGLTRLSINDEDLSDQGVATLVASENVRNLKDLRLISKRIGPAGARAIAQSPLLASLEELTFGEPGSSQIGDEGAAALAGSPHMANMRVLRLRHQGFSAKGARALAETRSMTRLRELYLDCNDDIGSEGVRALVKGPWPELKVLNLFRCGVDDDGAKALAEEGRLAKLTELVLPYNRIGPAGIAAMCRSDRFDQLESLDLRENPIGDEGAKALCESKTLGKLTELEVELPDGRFSPAVAKALKKRFGVTL